MAIRFNEARYRYVFQSSVGPVGRFLGRTGVRVESVAKAIATAEGLVRTGRYRASINWRITHRGSGLVLQVGSNVPHARLLEHGTPPHIIAARNKRALWWDMPNDRGWLPQPALTDIEVAMRAAPDPAGLGRSEEGRGRPVRYVEHPGTRAYRVIGRAVDLVIGHGLRIAPRL